MSKEFCSYHPSRGAVDKCQRCNRLICLSDKIVINGRQSSGIGNDSYSYAVQYVFCPICKYESSVESKIAIQKFGNTGFKMLIGFFVVAIFMVVVVFNTFNQATSGFGGEEGVNFFLPVVIFLIIGSTMMFVFFRFGNNIMGSAVNKNIEISKIERDQFLASLSPEQQSKMYKKEEFTCNQCGSAIPRDSFYCMNCGDSTKDERMQYGN